MLQRTVLSLIALGCVTIPCFAGTLYVPIVATEIDGLSYETQISITNSEPEDAQYVPYFIPLGADGTVRDEEDPPLSVMVLGNRTVTSPWAPGQLGMLEIESDDALVYQARLVGGSGPGATIGTLVPIISSRNVIPANRPAFLQAWTRTETLLTDFGLINLGQTEATCLVDVTRRGGLSIVRDVPIGMKPLSTIHVTEVLELLGEDPAAEIRAKVVCDQAFYTYAVTFDRVTGESRFINPSTQGSSGVIISETPPGPGPGGPTECAATAICFEEPGVVHVPTSTNRVKRVSVVPPFGTYQRLRVVLTVINGGWSSNSDGTHSIFWLARDRNRDLFGYVNVRGPGRNNIFIRHGIGQPQGAKPKIEANWAMQTGVAYRFEYIYDTAQRFIELTVRDPDGNVVLTMAGAPDVNNIRFVQGQDSAFHIDFGFSGANPNEPPTFGWTYRDLLMEFTP